MSEEQGKTDWAAKFTRDVVDEMVKIGEENSGVVIPASKVMAHTAFWMKVFNDGMGDDPRALMTLAWLVSNSPVTSMVLPEAGPEGAN